MATARSTSLETRLSRLEAAETLRDLVARYAEAADRGNDARLMREIFADDAIWEAPGFGAYRGGDVIAAALERIAAEKVVWALHLMGAPAIKIAPNGASATLAWRLWELAQLKDGKAPPTDHWLGGGYTARAIRDADGRWRFSHVALNLSLIAPVGAVWRPQGPQG
jgi:hypothetical protein